MASDLLAKIGIELDARIEELRPLALEYESLHAAAESLGTAQNTSAAPVLAKPRAKKTTAKKASAKETAVKPAAAKRTTVKPVAVQKAAAKGTQRTPRGSAASALGQAASGASIAKSPRKARRRASIGRYEQVVLDALEHGSHTVGELVMVTAMGAKEIRGGVNRLLSDRGIVKVDRGGKTAYALPSTAPKGSGAHGQGKSAKG
jgi:hypothetical protein